MLLHSTGCSFWTGAARCTCPRPWRIRKVNPIGDTARGWQVYRLVETDGSYTPVLRAPSHAAAISLVNSLTAIANRYTSPAGPP